MALRDKMEKAINDQINAELFSSYLYKSMASWFESQDLPGMANWMNIQAKEEMDHAMKFYDYVIERGGRVIFQAIEAPQSNWESPLDAFKAAYDHEVYISRRIDDLMDMALEEKDHATRIMLNWFVEEQVEEEDNASTNVAKVEMLKDSKRGMYMLDKEFASRVYNPPVAE
ncbi:ferritin [Dethiosulfovibrio salsuginis]|uniref:Ferritin n=1 Tax=Dethiosulfovibrio salsuginis TaxID=561720 RepID=A0A1X7JWT1_9BACT|nr:ferritin [Dethiosulfovibrio salsuginis]SMG32621.1 ferritin [Dethiosulfovibrio salsuginis]